MLSRSSLRFVTTADWPQLARLVRENSLGDDGGILVELIDSNKSSPDSASIKCIRHAVYRSLADVLDLVLSKRAPTIDVLYVNGPADISVKGDSTRTATRIDRRSG